ncbi:MAG: hypothetical protein SFW65_02135 [Alphaproteobacteria bacterium]|nr:hypothetical protein [Alphaproteobacteria bacterium]
MALFRKNKYDERVEKNLYCTPDEIEQRQSAELLGLLDRWQRQEIEPWDVLLETAYIVGGRIGFIIQYSVVRDGPKSEVFPLEDAVNNIKAVMRPETLDASRYERKILPNIVAVRERLESGDFNSWQASVAIAEIMLNPPRSRFEFSFREDDEHPLIAFKQGVEKERKQCEAKRRDSASTLGIFEPETEEKIKGELAHHFAKLRAREAYMAQRTPLDESIDGLLGVFGVSYEHSSSIKEGEAVEFLPPIEYPGRTLCSKAYITPTGTALIELDEDGTVEPHERGIYGTTVGRITTYSIEFVPKEQVDLELLASVVRKAVEVLGTYPYPYNSPEWTPSGEGYEGVRGYRGMVFPSEGRVTLFAKLDLDDLWRLYYLVEPVLEPSEQIAAAMNAARYAEERGAVLVPSGGFDYLDEGHSVEDSSGYIKKDDPNILRSGLRDAVSDLVLNKIDEAGFLIRVVTLADHTLTGRIIDRTNSFPSFDKMIAEQGGRSDLATYEGALKQRTQEFVRGILGLPEDSDIPLHMALRAAVKEIGQPLKQRQKENDAAAQQAKHALIEEQWQRITATPITVERIFAEIEQGADKPKVKKKAEETSPDARTDLVIVDSEVEPCIDGLYCDGRYRTRTKGSPFVRKEMPSALQPFCPQGTRPRPQMLLGDPKNILG